MEAYNLGTLGTYLGVYQMYQNERAGGTMKNVVEIAQEILEAGRLKKRIQVVFANYSERRVSQGATSKSEKPEEWNENEKRNNQQKTGLYLIH